MISILLVHSEYSSLTLLTKYIQKIFLYSTIYDAYTLEEAGNISKEKNINLILFDLDIHDEGNVTNFIQRLKQHILTEHIPIIFLTEAKKESFYKKVAGLSGYDFIQKPIDKNMFILKLHNYSKIYTNIQVASNGINDSLIYSETNTDGIIIRVSKPMQDISGYTQEELLGNSHSIIRHPNMPKSFYTNIWNTIQNGSTWTGVIKNKRKDNSAYIVKATIYPMLDTNNKILTYASVQHDITKEMMDIQKNKKILDAQSSLIIILTNDITTYANNTLFKYYNFKKLTDFTTQHKSISELFEAYDDQALMPYMNGDTSWTEYLQKHTHQKNPAYITDKFAEQHIYDVQYRGKLSKEQELFVFTDITHIKNSLHSSIN